MYGHLNNVNYVRYMQEAALDASVDAGWGMENYQAIGRMWLIRETEIEYFQPLLYNEAVTITTWVEDFWKVQSRRAYEFHNENGDLVAKGATNWVFLDSETQKPAKIPDSVIEAFIPDGVTNDNRREKFPDAKTPPDDVFTLQKRVEWRDIDTVGHVNNAAYMSYCEDASTQVGCFYDWSMTRMMEDGFAMIARKYRILYLQPAFLDDEVEIACWFGNLKRAMATRFYTIKRVSDGELLARAEALWVCFNLNEQRPMRVPDQFLEDFRPNLSPEG
jgi:acyl-CoA thioester hydrolase